MYERMSDTNLLKWMEKGKTQNTNECLHSVIWSRCQKTVFIGKHKLHGATASAIASFNEGSSDLSQVMQKMAIVTNELLIVYMEEIDQRRITSPIVSSSATTQRERESGEMDSKVSRASQLGSS